MYNVVLQYNIYKDTIEDAAMNSLRSAKDGFNRLEKSDTETLSATLDSVMENEKYKKLFLDGDRGKLYNATSDFLRCCKYFVSKKCLIKLWVSFHKLKCGYLDKKSIIATSS